MEDNKGYKYKIGPEPILDEHLEGVAGGSYGQTAHTKYLTIKNYNQWICTSPDQIALFGAG